MSREIKFRGLVQDSPTAKPRWVYYGVGGKPYVLGRAEWLAEDLQYTGLKGKDEVEIYDGSIIKDGIGNVILVVWDESKATFALTKDGWLWTHYFGEALEAEDCEVIGNIYENKELLDA